MISNPPAAVDGGTGKGEGAVVAVPGNDPAVMLLNPVLQQK